MKFPADINLRKGELQEARFENLSTLPTFVPGEDEGRVLFAPALAALATLVESAVLGAQDEVSGLAHETG